MINADALPPHPQPDPSPTPLKKSGIWDKENIKLDTKHVRIKLEQNYSDFIVAVVVVFR